MQYSNGRFHTFSPQTIKIGSKASAGSTSYDYIRSASKRLGLQPRSIHDTGPLRFERFNEFLDALHSRLEQEARP